MYNAQQYRVPLDGSYEKQSESLYRRVSMPKIGDYFNYLFPKLFNLFRLHFIMRVYTKRLSEEFNFGR
jgi:hypothetical protein